MANQKITDLLELRAVSASDADVLPIVDVGDLSAPTGETKKIELGELSTYIRQSFLVTSSLVVKDESLTLTEHATSLNFTGNAVTASVLGTDVTIDINSASIEVKASGSVITSNLSSLDFVGTGVTASAAGNAVTVRIQGGGGGSNSFLDLIDTPDAYVTNSLVVTNPYNTGLIFLTEPTDDFDVFFGGKTFAHGTYYFNGNIKERIFANTDTSTIYNGTYSDYFEDFIHSGNIYLDKVNSNVYMCRGTWPRRMGTSSLDMHGFTWRETTPAGTNTAEAICMTRDDGANFKVLVDLYSSAIPAISKTTDDVKVGTTYVVSEPSAVVYDASSDKVYFACRNDHDESIVYRMSGSVDPDDSDTRAATIEVWAKMNSSDLKIDSLDIATTPANFYSASLPLVDTNYLYIGVTPDYNSATDTASDKHAAIFRVPTTGSSPGQFATDYPVAYTIHRFWASGLDATRPDMGKVGVKGIKVYFAADTTTPQEWVSGSGLPVKKENSRIYVVSSGAKSMSGVIQTDASSSQYPIIRTTTYSSSFALDIKFPSQSVNIGYHGSTIPLAASFTLDVTGGHPTVYWASSASVGPASDGYPQVPTLQLGDNYAFGPISASLPDPRTVIQAPTGVTSSNALTEIDNENFGGHALLELLVGDVAGTGLATDFDGTQDSSRTYKTWRRGSMVTYGSTSQLVLGDDDPVMPIGTIGSGIGVARDSALTVDDRLFLLTSPEHAGDYDGQTILGSAGGRGLSKILSYDGTGYEMEGTDGSTGLYLYVMVIPVLANTLDQETDAMSRSKAGLQQVAIDGINEKFYIADFNYYTIYNSTLIASSSTAGFRGFAGISAGSYENTQGDNFVNWTATTSSVAPYTVGNKIQGGYPDAGNRYYPANWDYSYPYTPTGSLTKTVLGSHPTVASMTGSDSYSDSQLRSLFSRFGTIFEGSLYVYSQNTNGQRLFNNEDTEIAYSRPCGLVGYNVGPNNEFRLIYTNGENNYTLLSNTLGYGIYINGLSRTFVKDDVLANGTNVLSLTDAGSGYTGGIVVSFIKPCRTSDYAITSHGSQGEVFGTGQYHNGNPVLSGSGQINTAIAQSNASVYYAKNKSKFRLTYSGSLPQVLHFACFQ